MVRASHWQVMRRAALVAGLVELEVQEVLEVPVASSSDLMARPLHQVWHHQRPPLLGLPRQTRPHKNGKLPKALHLPRLPHLLRPHSKLPLICPRPSNASVCWTEPKTTPNNWRSANAF